MTRSDLITGLLKDFKDLERAEMTRVVDCFFNEMINHLALGGRIELREFGSL